MSGAYTVLYTVLYIPFPVPSIVNIWLTFKYKSNDDIPPSAILFKGLSENFHSHRAVGDEIEDLFFIAYISAAILLCHRFNCHLLTTSAGIPPSSKSLHS
jgi:hypothetical protein